MSVEYQLAKVYLEKLYRLGLLTYAEMEQLDKEMYRLYGMPQGSRINKIA